MKTLHDGSSTSSVTTRRRGCSEWTITSGISISEFIHRCGDAVITPSEKHDFNTPIEYSSVQRGLLCLRSCVCTRVHPLSGDEVIRHSQSVVVRTECRTTRHRCPPRVLSSRHGVQECEPKNARLRFKGRPRKAGLRDRTRTLRVFRKEEKEVRGRGWGVNASFRRFG